MSAPVSFESTYAANSTTTGDYTGAGAVANSPLYFDFFAVAYGIDASSASFTPIYSFPISLYASIPYTLTAYIK